MAYAADASERRPAIKTVLNRLYELSESDNIAADLDDDKLGEIGTKVREEYDIDLQSRDDWEETAKKAMEAALQVRRPKSFPFENASNVKWPLLTTAALQFNARAYPAIISESGIVKGMVVGEDPDGAKAATAERIGEHMSYQLLHEIPGWEEDMDVMLMQLPILGCAFKKVYYDPGLERPCVDLRSALDIVVNQSVKVLSRAPRITDHVDLYPYEIEERKRDGRFLDIDLEYSSGDSDDNDAPQKFLEQHRRWDLDDDGYAEPYIVTVHQESAKVVRIVANFDTDDVEADEERGVIRIEPREYFIKYDFIPDPEGGFYGIGFGGLLESIGASIDTTVNQITDAATLQNAGGGFLGSGVRFKKNLIRRELGKWVTVDVAGTTLRENMVAHQDPGPSPVLFNLLGLLIEAARDITAVKDILTGDTGERTQTATTTLALIEQGMKVFTAIYKRIHRSLSKEFKMLFRINGEYLADETYFNVLDDERAVAKSDYDSQNYDVCPVADPSSVTDMQRLGRAQFLLQTFTDDPMIDQVELKRRILSAARIEDIDKLLVPPEPDPMQEAAAELEMAGMQAEVEKTRAQTETEQAKALKMGMDAATEQDKLDLEQAKADFQVAAEMSRAKAKAAEAA